MGASIPKPAALMGNDMRTQSTATSGRTDAFLTSFCSIAKAGTPAARSSHGQSKDKQQLPDPQRVSPLFSSKAFSSTLSSMASTRPGVFVSKPGEGPAHPLQCGVLNLKASESISFRYDMPPNLAFHL